MTIRRLAGAIVSTAVRHATPESRDWGNAMLRELDFVEGDWAALSWAVGSAATLLKGVDMPMKGLADLPRKVQSFEKEIRRSKVRACAVRFVESMAVTPFIFFYPHQLQGFGALFIVFACFEIILIQVTQVHMACARGAGTSVAIMDSFACLDSFRAKLALQRDVDVWGIGLLLVVVLYIPGWMLFCGGLLITPAGITRQSHFAVCTIIFPVLSLLLNLDLAHKYKHQIDELDALRKMPR